MESTLIRNSINGCAMAIVMGMMLSLPCQAQEMEERILDLESTIAIRADTSVEIVERVKVLALGERIVHGLIRKIPSGFTDLYDFEVMIRVSVQGVLLDGEPIAVVQEQGDGEIRLVMGDQDSHLSPGEHVFELRYTVYRQLRYGQEYDALLWQVTNPGWGMPVDGVRATVHLPEEGIPYLDHFAEIGSEGGYTQDVTVEEPRPGVMVFTSDRPLAPDEELHIGVAWPKGLVMEPSANEYYRQND